MGRVRASFPSAGAARAKALRREGAGGRCSQNVAEGLSTDGAGWKEGRERRLTGGEGPEAWGFLILSKWPHDRGPQCPHPYNGHNNPYLSEKQSIWHRADTWEGELSPPCSASPGLLFLVCSQ